jgi:hypothetical protein
MTQPGASQPERVEPINEILYVALTNFADVVKAADVDINSVFQKIMFHAIANFEIAQAEISLRFGLSRGTISKWMNGKATPHPMVRRLVVDWIAEQAHSRATDLDGVREALKAPAASSNPQIAAE